MTTTSAPTLTDHLAEPLRLGAPDIHGALAVFPLFGPAPQLGYVSFAQAVGHGVSLKELEHGASVNDLLVLNPTDHAVLLYEGEEVLGAQQNRTFDVSVLVGARSRLQVPVSCVEAGRWDGSRSGEAFQPAPQAAYPSLRRQKNRAAGMGIAAGAAPRASQRAVWDEVAARSEALGVTSDTGAMNDIYDNRRDRLDEACAAVHLQPGQTGALVLVGGEPAVLDHVSRPEVFTALHAPLVQGYALDALDAREGRLPEEHVADAFLQRILSAPVTEHDGIGLGRDVRFASGLVAGAGLVAGSELVQLTAFPDDVPTRQRLDHERPARIRRPSRRRAT